jgi:hypothetical protein
MPRAAVHARRDAPTIAGAFAAVGIPVPDDLDGQLVARHRAIDARQEDPDMPRHFMRGPDVQDASEAVARALAFLHERATRAVKALAAARVDPAPPVVTEAVRALADACHGVRDSYSRGHTHRAPTQAGPRVAGVRSWEEDKLPTGGFGLAHVVLHDLRFEFPFDRASPEVAASDEAVARLVEVVCAAAQRDGPPQEQMFKQDWTDFVAAYFLPPGSPAPTNERVGPEPG